MSETPRFGPTRRRFRPAALLGSNVIGPDTQYTITLAEIREREKSHAAHQVFLYRSHEIDLSSAPASHFNAARGNIHPLRQHTELGGINSCVNTTQLNAMLWQGQISQAVAERIDRSLTREFRPHFGEPFKAESGRIFQVGNLAIAKHFSEVSPEADFSYFEAQFAGRDMARVALTELLRGSVVTVNMPEHVVLAVGYADLNHADYANMSLIVCDPLSPSHLRRQPLASLRKTSMIMPSLADPIRKITDDIT